MDQRWRTPVKWNGKPPAPYETRRSLFFEVTASSSLSAY